MSLNLTPEEIALLDKFAAASLAGVNASNPNITHEQAAECSLCDALAMIERRRLVLAEHAAPTVKESLPVELPANITPLPEGFAYFGFGSIPDVPKGNEYDDVAYYSPMHRRWEVGCGGTVSIRHHALRAGSDIARRNGLEGGAK